MRSNSTKRPERSGTRDNTSYVLKNYCRQIHQQDLVENQEKLKYNCNQQF